MDETDNGGRKHQSGGEFTPGLLSPAISTQTANIDTRWFIEVLILGQGLELLFLGSNKAPSVDVLRFLSIKSSGSIPK
jgi:hypothetical protein